MSKQPTAQTPERAFLGFPSHGGHPESRNVHRSRHRGRRVFWQQGAPSGGGRKKWRRQSVPHHRRESVKILILITGGVCVAALAWSLGPDLRRYIRMRMM
jgi:hypothetical protein